MNTGNFWQMKIMASATTKKNAPEQTWVQGQFLV
jgi:hypothetical protein